MLEYRVCWEASSNINFHGCTDWQPWDGDPEDSHDDIEEQLFKGGGVCEGLEEAIEGSGFGWRVETREPE